MTRLPEPFGTAWQRTLGRERGYSDHPADRGGATRHGITEAVARAHGYLGDMQALPLTTAQAIARAHYWDLLRGDQLAAVEPAIAIELFDTAYHMGPGTAGQMLQRLLNVLNREGRDYPDLAVDGLIGPVTLARLRAYQARRGQEGLHVLVVGLNCLQGERLVAISEARPSQEAFTYGWLAQRVAADLPRREEGDQGP